MTRPRQPQRGFSLLEILIATAILAVVFAYVSGAVMQGGYFQVKAPLYTQAAMLLRGAVLDVEEEYQTDGFPENDISNETCDLPSDAGRDYSCEYDLERLDLESNDLGEMSAQLMEQIGQEVGNGNILQAFPGLRQLVLWQLQFPGQPLPLPTCPVTPDELLNMCSVRLDILVNNITQMVGFFPIIIAQAADQTRKLTVRISHPAHGKEPVLEVETFIIAVPELLEALTQEGALDPVGGQPGLSPGMPATGQPATGSPAGGQPQGRQ